MGVINFFNPKTRQCARHKFGSYYSSFMEPDIFASDKYFIYDEMQRDPQVSSCLDIKKSLILGGGYEILPYDNSPRDG